MKKIFDFRSSIPDLLSDRHFRGFLHQWFQFISRRQAPLLNHFKSVSTFIRFLPRHPHLLHSNPPNPQSKIPSFKNRKSRIENSSAFTILELLAAFAVVALVLVLLLQIANQTLQASRTTTQQLNATQDARRALDMLASDIANAVITGGATILFQGQNPPTLAMLTTGRGPNGQGAIANRFIGVSYELNNREFIRGYSAVEYTTSNLLTEIENAATPPDKSVLAKGVLQFTVLANLEDGTTKPLDNLPNSAEVGSGGSYSGYTVPSNWTALVPASYPVNKTAPRVRSLLVAIATVDEQNLSTFEGKLPTFTQPSSDPVSTWESELASQDIPDPLRAAIRFQSKTIPLP